MHFLYFFMMAVFPDSPSGSSFQPRQERKNAPNVGKQFFAGFVGARNEIYGAYLLFDHIYGIFCYGFTYYFN